MTPQVSNAGLAILVFMTLSLSGCTIPLQISSGPGAASPSEFSYGVPYTAVVTSISDGDTFNVIFPEGNEERVRILGIDTPEKTAAANMPGEYGPVADPASLEYWGAQADAYTRNHLLHASQVSLEFDRSAGIRDGYGRLLAYVTLQDGSDHGAALIRNGLARVYEQETFSRRPWYLSLQDQAVALRIGIWNSGTVPSPAVPKGIIIADVHFDAGGDDRQNLNDEYVVVTNHLESAVNLSGWILTESGGVSFVFPPVILRPGSPLTVRTGSGTPTHSDLYMELSSPVLNNDRDTVTLTDQNGTVVSTYRWGDH